jgi:hypothetical protein
MYALEHRVGRLFEIRIWSPVSLEEATAWGRDHNAIVDRMQGPYICFVDLVDATVFPPDVVDAYVRVMKSEPSLIRTGTLLNPDPVLGLQIQRMIREANNPNRRAFRDPDALVAWLGEVLSVQERIRLAAVLRETGRVPA